MSGNAYFHTAPDIAPDEPFQYSFVDQNFDALFRAEQRMSQIILVFTVLAISIACLGLFGLAAYTTEQRRKKYRPEISWGYLS